MFCLVLKCIPQKEKDENTAPCIFVFSLNDEHTVNEDEYGKCFKQRSRVQAKHSMGEQANQGTNEGAEIDSLQLRRVAAVDFVSNYDIIKTFPETTDQGNEQVPQDIYRERTGENFLR